MITAIDTNVIVALLREQDALNMVANSAMEKAASQGKLVICGPVFAELSAFPSQTEEFLDSFLSDTMIEVDWKIDRSIWRSAGEAFRTYSERRRRQKVGLPRRILADFIIGAHADENSFALLTFDGGIYKTAFPQLQIIES